MTTDNNQHNPRQISKRQLLQSIGMVSGSAAVFTALQGWSLAQASSPHKAPPILSNEGNGKKLIILGAGLAGMVIALEMSKKGYVCQIIEAQDKIGGRCQSARKGSVIEEVGNEKQICNYKDDQYFNYGPWRIPAQHHPTLHYCHTLGVKLEPLINKSPMAYYYSENITGPLKGVPVRQHDIDMDRMGHINELLAKCADQGRLDDMVSQEDKEMLLEYLRDTGLLDTKQLNYRANQARGFSDYPGAGMDFGVFSEPYSLSDVFKIKPAVRLENEDHPIVMFQPVGGMDQIAKAIHNALPSGIVKLNSEVTDIMQNENGVAITYKDTKTGKTVTEKGDYCVSTIPFPVVSSINNNFNDELNDAIKAPTAVPAFKLGIQLDRRFWEQDEMIYGGQSFSDIPGHSTTAYPSSELHSNKGGVLLAAYIWGGEAARLSNLNHIERAEFGLSVGEKIHPGNFRKNYSGNAMSIAWHNHKYQLGGWVAWTRRKRERQLPTILKGENRILFSGNGISTIHTGWMVGAIEAAWYTISEIDKRVGKT
jgi:monoamine oxidase